jgi:DNA-directed RNA polymerase subunit M/transcription elongation factor TFIIS
MQLMRMRPRQKPIFSSLNEIEIVLSAEQAGAKSAVSRDIPAPLGEGKGREGNDDAKAATEGPLPGAPTQPTTVSADGCPECLEGKVCRLRRRYWMRMLPHSKLYRCEACQTRFLTMGRWILLLPSKAE